MTPREQAKEIYEEYAETIPGKTYGVILERDWVAAKACAILHCQGIIEVYKDILKDDGGYPDRGYYKAQKQFWKDVLNEINNL